MSKWVNCKWNLEIASYNVVQGFLNIEKHLNLVFRVFQDVQLVILCHALCLGSCRTTHRKAMKKSTSQVVKHDRLAKITMKFVLNHKRGSLADYFNDLVSYFIG